jgi:hypothetical protein
MKSYMHKSTSDARSSSSVLTDVTSKNNDIYPVPSFLKALADFESVSNPATAEGGDILNETFSRSSGGTLIETTNRLSEVQRSR